MPPHASRSSTPPLATGVSRTRKRAISRVATTDTQRELIELRERYPAGELGRVLAARQRDRLDSSDLTLFQLDSRTASWRTEPDGMVAMTLRMTPEQAAVVCATVDAGVMSNNEPRASADASSTLAQLRCDALVAAIERSGGADGEGGPAVEVLIHVHVDDESRIVGVLQDGTPLSTGSVDTCTGMTRGGNRGGSIPKP